MELESLLPSFEPIIALQKQIQKRKDQVVALRTLNEEKTKEAQTIGKSLFEIRKHWNPILRKLDVSLTTSKVKYGKMRIRSICSPARSKSIALFPVSLKKKVDNLQSEVDGLKHFMDAVGLKTAINDEDDETENLKYFSIQYHKIFYNGQNCKLYFSVLDLPGPFSGSFCIFFTICILFL